MDSIHLIPPWGYSAAMSYPGAFGQVATRCWWNSLQGAVICSKDFVLIMTLVSLEYIAAKLQVDLNRTPVYRYIQQE